MEEDLETLSKCSEVIEKKCSTLPFPYRWDEKQTSEKECHKIKDEFIILLDNAMQKGSAQFLEEATILNETWSNGMIECKDGTDPGGYDSIRSFTQRMSKRLQKDCVGEIVTFFRIILEYFIHRCLPEMQKSCSSICRAYLPMQGYLWSYKNCPTKNYNQ